MSLTDKFGFLKGHAIFPQIIRFLAVGGVVYISDLSVFIILQYENLLNPVGANMFAKTAGAIIGFILHKYFTFAGAQKTKLKVQIPRYILLWLVNMGLAAVLIWAFVSIMGFSVYIGKFSSDIIVILVSFFASRLFVFSRPR